MSKETLKLALEALQECRRDPRLKYEYPTYDKAIKPLEEALAKQEQGDPVALPPVKFEKVAEGIEVGYDILGGVDIRLGGDFVYVHINYDYRYTHNAGRKALADQIVGLLTTPQQRTWVGLTDEEISTVANNNHPLDGIRSFARAIEAKLRSKNNG